MSDVTFDMQNNRMEVHQRNAEPWRVTLVDTGDTTSTGGRLKRVADYVKNEAEFCFTYGDGVADIDIGALIAFHRQHGKRATITAVQPPGRYGALSMDGKSVCGFTEKPQGDGGRINGGFFVLSPGCIDLIEADSSAWEGKPLSLLAAHGHPARQESTGGTLAIRQCAVEGVEVNPEFWRGKRVFLTGYTGFKGGWLSLWLQSMGAEVHGYALNPPTATNLFEVAEIARGMASSTIADIREADKLRLAMQSVHPEVVFHLAAQPLVRHSYVEPVETYAVNVMGTVRLLEAVRATPGVKALVNVTTDKCYENREWLWGYRESEALGGFDPYSSSKACAELVTSAYRRSFLGPAGVALASARAGNVIGGRDWAEDRLIPDFLRAMDSGELLKIRFPGSTRPWQHVLEPLSGYLMLAERLYADGAEFAEGWNFGPGEDGAKPVGWIVERLAEMRGGVRWQSEESQQPHEANYLKLDSSKARARLHWQPRWSLQQALQKTLEWHDAWRNGGDMRAFTLNQIGLYQAEYPSGCPA